MSEQLKHHLNKVVEITDEEFPSILEYFETVKLKKKQNLQQIGQVCHSNYFVEIGCIRMFFVNEKGIEQTTQFAIENWWITDYLAYTFQKESEFTLQAVERTTVLSIHFQAQEKLLKEFPKLEKYFRHIYQRAYAASQMRMKFMYDFSKEELYLHFNKHFPEFVQRVPQYLLASFLGLTPEYLSEIRKKSIS
ncbi:Crp/Fnr family transcriptional regulator [Limibacter armeniacum]|uniref:Crp/Fnr family transcriptional regulator n=1 Tax=Limibacter armeniacum TaxID=466084 RepID=UPI002FE6AC89